MRSFLYGHEASWFRKNQTYKTLEKAWQYSIHMEHLYIYEDDELITVLNIKESLEADGYRNIHAGHQWKRIVIERSKRLMESQCMSS